MRTTLFTLIAVAALAGPASAQQPSHPTVGIYPSLTTFPQVRNPSAYPGGSHTLYPPRNAPLDPAVVNYPFLANGRVYTMGQMYQAFGYAPYSVAPRSSYYGAPMWRSGSNYGSNWRW